MANAWTGQKDSIRLYQTPDKTLPKRLDELGEKFDIFKHGPRLEPQKDPDFLKNLLHQLENYTLELDGLQVKVNYRKKEDQKMHLISQKMRSAYAEDFAARLGAHHYRVGMHGEMLASTIPIQDPYAVTVDYILYSID